MASPDPFAFSKQFDAFGQPIAQSDPVEEARRRNNGIAVTINAAPPPDVVGKATRAARQIGVAPGLVDDQVEQALRGINIKSLTATMQQFPVFGKFFGENPRAAVMAQEDGKLLGQMRSILDPSMPLKNWKSFQGTIRKAPQELVGVGGPTALGMMNDMAQTALDASSSLTGVITKPMNMALDPLYRAWGIDTQAQDRWLAKRRESQKAGSRAYFKGMAEGNRPTYSNATEEAVLRGLDSTVSSLMALATRNPNAAAAAFGAGAGASSYQDMKAEGRNTPDAIRYALQQGIPEAVFERAPASALIEALVKRLPTGQTFAKFMAEELPGEMATTFVQSYSDWQMKNPSMGADEWVATLPGDMQATVLGVLGGGTAQVALAKTAERSVTVAGKVMGRVVDAEKGKEQGARFAGAMKSAEASKLREHDPETFRDAMRAVADDVGATHVYIPGEAAQAYLQSDFYDPDSDPLSGWSDAIEEAYSTGTDFVMPIEDALTVLPGSKAWETLKDDIRLEGGGMSAREAQDFEAAIDDVMAEISDTMAKQDEETRASLTAQDALIRSMQDQLQNAGLTPYAARTIAEVTVRKEATRASRMGRELSGNELDRLKVERVMPPALAEARKADATDLVINALRKGKDAAVYDGPSLIEWISKNGGIWDGDPNSDFKGGDFKAMGLDKWHRAKKGRRKVIRDPKLGAGSRGADVVLVDAIEAGYFPELNGYDVAPDAAVLQAAIDAELSGKPRYAGEPRVDPMRAAAEELAQLLGERGLDPEGMSDAELRQVIAQLDEARDGGFEQLPDVIDIDGEMKPTRNSEGQPIAGSEEGVRAFYRWFGDSKVVDEEGRPLVVYHGTRSEFEAFDTEAIGKRHPTFSFGFHFSDRREEALSYGKGPRHTIAGYMAISNPLMLETGKIASDKADNDRAEIIREIVMSRREAAAPAVSDLALLAELGVDTTGMVEAPVKAKQAYDGVIIEGSDGLNVIAFSPTQIKSINNRGTFDPGDARILYQAGDPVIAEIDAAWDGKKTRGPISLGAVPAVLQAYGYKPETFKIDRGKVNKIAGDHPDLPREVLYGLPRLLSKPWAIFPSTDSNKPNALVVALAIRDNAGNPVLAIVDQDGTVGFVSSVYGKQDKAGLTGDQRVEKMLADAKANGQKVYEGKTPPERDPEPISGIIPARQRKSILSLGGKSKTLNDGPRGRIVFDQGQRIIQLFQSSNLSTPIHELGHMWLEDLKYDAESPDAPEQLKNDWQTIQDWFAENGHPVTDGIIPTEAHELWARGTERYMMEGKSPSPALQRLVETFRGWLVSIYKTVKALRAPITPEIRSVFDRLLATDEEIAAMNEQQALEPLFKDAASAGLNDGEFEAYTATVDQARGDAKGALLKKTMNAVRQRVTKEHREQRAKVEADVAESVDARPLFKALRMMRVDPVNAQWIRDEMGADALDLMPRRVPPVWKDGGIHPDMLAEMSGFASGKVMIEALIGAEIAHRQAREGGDQRTLRARTIAEETDAEMRSRYGDPFTDGSIEREALAAVHNEKQGEVFAAEARALARKTGQRPTPYRIARDWARRRVRQGTYAVEASPSAIQRHARNAAKAGRDAEKAYIAGDFEEALRFKQQQMLANALLSEAKAANDEVEAARKRMDKVARRATSKSVDQDYLDQAHALLEEVDLRESTQKSLTRQSSWAEWAAARAEEGYDVVVPESFAATIAKTNWSRLPIETLLGLDAAVSQVMHLGRLKRTLLDNKERRDFDELVSEAKAGGANIDGPPPADLMEPGWWDALKAKVASADASLLKMETVFDWLDGGNSNGVFNRIVFRPVAEAQGREQDMLKDYYGRIKALFEAVPAEITQRWSDTVTLPFVNRETGRPERLRRQQLIAVALNVGNEGNLQRLTDGYGWSADALLDYLNSELTGEEWRLVQGVWDTIDTLWPEIEELEKRVNGVAPEKIEPREIVTPFGTFRGGYYPAVYDSTRNYRAEENRGKESDLFEGGYTRATTRSSATKARLDKVSQPILLQLGVINRHLGEVIHDVTHREAVIQANKFLTDARVMRIVDEALGPEIRKQLRPWVKFVANSWAIERAGNEGAGKWLGKLRANVTAVGMGLRATTMMTQIAGYSNSFEVVGEKWVSEAILRTTAHPVESFNFVLEKSSEVRGRMDNLDRDIRTELARLSASNPVSKAGLAVLEGRKFFFHGIGYMDRVVVVPTWLGAYNKALAEGMADQDAIYAADKAVRVSQGSGAPKDMATIQRGTGRWGEALKLMTMFYSYFSAMYQRERTLGRDVMGADTRKPRNVPRLAARAFWLLIVPPLLTEAIKASLGGGDAPDDDEWWTQWLARKMVSNALGPIPLARDIFEPAWNKARGGQTFNPTFTPIQRVYDSVVNVSGDFGDIARGDETTKATKHILETVGYATGLVPGQVASATQFLVDVGAGDADPEGLADWIEGLSKGKID